MLICSVVNAYDGTGPFAMGHLRTLPVIPTELTPGDFVFVTFTVSSYDWTKGQKDRENNVNRGSSSPQKMDEQGYKKALSFNIQDVVCIECREDEGEENASQDSGEEEEAEII